MRLINTVTFEMQEFFDAQIPSYAILSHRWQRREISYQDYLQHCDDIASSDNKIQRFCSLSRETYNCSWAWVDTCCIDKSSSAELSEAINSMFRWYSDAKICVAYLSDTDTVETLMSSEWFTRGWTLQELLAPLKVDLYNVHWDLLGTRTDLAELISSATGIRTSLLVHFRLNAESSRPAEFKGTCVAEKMSWASKRVTSRREDMAYCLMGLFDVNMPLLYGEGDKAFYRLQQEIIRESDDESIFAWSAADETRRGILAASPHDFQLSVINHSSDEVGYDKYTISELRERPYQITNRGLHFRGRLVSFLHFRNRPRQYTKGLVIRSYHHDMSTEGPIIPPLLVPIIGPYDDRYYRSGDLIVLHSSEYYATPNGIELIKDGEDIGPRDMTSTKVEEVYLALRI